MSSPEWHAPRKRLVRLTRGPSSCRPTCVVIDRKPRRGLGLYVSESAPGELFIIRNVVPERPFASLTLIKTGGADGKATDRGRPEESDRHHQGEGRRGHRQSPPGVGGQVRKDRGPHPQRRRQGDGCRARGR